MSSFREEYMLLGQEEIRAPYFWRAGMATKVPPSLSLSLQKEKEHIQNHMLKKQEPWKGLRIGEDAMPEGCLLSLKVLHREGT